MSSEPAAESRESPQDALRAAVAGVLSTMDFQPSRNHPARVLLWADQVILHAHRWKTTILAKPPFDKPDVFVCHSGCKFPLADDDFRTYSELESEHQAAVLSGVRVLDPASNPNLPGISE